MPYITYTKHGTMPMNFERQNTLLKSFIDYHFDQYHLA